MKCPKCNADNPVGSVYCSTCQAILSQKIRPSPMECPRCGAVYKSPLNLKYCSKCQCELVERKKNKNFAILITSVSAVLILILGMISVFFIYPVVSFNSAVKNGDTNKLVSVFKSHPSILDNDSRMKQYIALIDRRAESYFDETIDFTMVTNDFENFETINSHLLSQDSTDTFQNQYKRISRIHESREAYFEAVESLNSKAYKDAESKFISVISEDINYYSLAQDKLEEIKGIKNSYLQEADNLMSIGEYEKCVSTLTDGLSYFDYDPEFAMKYTDSIALCIEKECDTLIEQGLFFSDGDKTGAFNIIYSYLNQESYSGYDSLKKKLNEIVEKSEEIEIANASSALGLTNRSEILDSCGIQAAKDYIADSSIQENSEYILSLCKNSSDVQHLINNISKDKQLNVALITNIAMNASDFSKVSEEQIDAYRKYNWDYTGIGRYYDEEKRCFGWATIIIYEME